MNIMIKRVLNTIEKHNLIKKGESVVVGVSGGPDSVCLIHILSLLAHELGIKGLYAVHINHMLRGKEALHDEEYVEELCAKIGVRLFSEAHDIKAISRKMGVSLEEAGREIRYRQFETKASEIGAEKIAVAHNKNDQAETILMHIMRGTGLDGLKGIDYIRGKIIRPLLDIDRREIEEYCEKNKLNPRIDSSNLENIYTRNKVRLDLIPYINKVFQTDIAGSLVKMSSLIRDDSTYIEDNVVRIYNQSVVEEDKNGICLELSRINEQHPAIKKRLIRYAVKKIKGDLKGIESIHVEDALWLAQSGRTGAEIHLPLDIRIKKSYNVLKIGRLQKTQEISKGFKEELMVPGKTFIIDSSAYIISSIEEADYNKDYNKSGQNSLVQVFDYEKLKLGVEARLRKEGDLFKPYKSNGTKKLKEYFIDSKIPKEKRNEIPIIAKGSEVVWIIGYKISDKFKVTENTKSILKLEYKKQGEEST